MQRLSDQIGKAGTNALTFVAASVQSNKWLHGRLLEYVAQGPFMMQHGEEVASLETELQGMVLGAAAVDSLTRIVARMPSLQRGLRSGATRRLYEIFRQKVDEFWLLEKESMAMDALSKVSSLFVECSLLYPLDVDLHAYMQECAAMTKKQTQGELMKTMKRLCMSLVDADASKVESFQKATLALIEGLSAVGVGTGEHDEAQKVVFKKAIKALFAFAVEQDWFEPVVAQNMEKCAEAVDRLAQFVNEPSTTEEAGLLQDVVALTAGVNSLAAAKAAEERPLSKMLPLVTNLERQKAKMKQKLKCESLKSHVAHPLASKMLAFGEEMVVSEMNSMVVVSLEAVSVTSASVKLVAGGMTDGSTWLYDPKPGNWEELKARAQTTLLTLDGSKMAGLMGELQQVSNS